MTPWTTTHVEVAYRALLRALRLAQLDEFVLTSHWPLVGTAPDRILVVGQAVFGWPPSWHATDLSSQEGIDSVLRQTQPVFYDLDDPMEWIATNRARSSPFWRVVRQVVESAFPESDMPWYSHVAWTNIYPVARNDVKGNPEGDLRTSQTKPAATLLDTVAQEVAPLAVLVLGGAYWWDVAELLPLDSPIPAERPLLTLGSRHGVKWIVGMHPGGAQRRGWGSSAYAQRLVEALR